MIDDINKKPDPQFERYGLMGWKIFKEHFLAIKKDFDLYGDIVLEKRLDESIAIYKDAFTSENFIAEIRKIWEERYHYIANDYTELIALYERGYNEEWLWGYLLPERERHCPGETRGRDKTVSLSLSFYDLIIKEAQKNNDKILLLKENKVYEITIERDKDPNNLNYKIKMEEAKIIEVT